MKTLVVLVACGGLLAAAGCTKSSKLDEATWCAKAAEVQCRWIYSCCNLGERLDLTGLNAHEESEATCREQLTAGCLDDWAVALASMTAGRLSFDFENANTCLEDMQTTASQCPAVMEAPDECEHVIAGLVGIDGECAYDAECAGQARCRHLGTGASGRCYDKVGQDGLCESSADCQEGLFCYQGAMTQYVCVAIPTVPAGEDCNGATLGCDAGYYCDPETDTCAARKGSGEDCNDGPECQEGLICDSSYQCGAGLGTGQDCSYGYDNQCAASLYCDSMTYQCTPRKAAGASCNSALECDAGSYCDAATDRCVARKPAGETCSTGTDSCQAATICLPRGKCAPRGDVGSECYSDDQCLERLDCSPVDRICEMQPLKLGVGAFCLENADCESSRCEANECIGFCTGEL